MTTSSAVIKTGDKALTRLRLTSVDWGYFNAPGISAASALMVQRQGEIDIASDWSGGHVASVDGMRFTVPVCSLHSRPNRKYFSTGRGATWLNVVSDRVMGLGGIVTPGTLRDSLGFLDAVFNLDTRERPEIIITDTGSYSDLVFGLFAICGYQFSPRIADISDARLWRFDLGADYGPLQPVSRQRVQVERIRSHWEDMLRVAGSLQTGKVRAYDLLRMMTSGDRMTGLGDPFAHYGRVFKTLHLLQFIDSEAYRRMMGAQLNIGEGRHALGRRISFGRLGELRHGYRDGMEDQLSALGLGAERRRVVEPGTYGPGEGLVGPAAPSAGGKGLRVHAGRWGRGRCRWPRIDPHAFPDKRPTRLGDAFAYYGWILRSPTTAIAHMIGKQLNITEAHRLAAHL